MGVDASYLYGYGADLNNIEWDVDYLKEKFKDKLNQKVRDESWSMTYQQVIESIECYIEDGNSECVYEVGQELGFDLNYDDEDYLTFNHKHIAKMFPDAKLSELDEVAKLYAKEIGIKNVDDIKWIEWGYFS